ncbi:TetR/AcrR family transcriptional regulator [Sinorhizobium meliloti]|uniref:TetR/AcrR family transcriptional regulator n=2 Tax=Rhizobium meliloti TaxID=382 RepID=UPI000FD7272F|nr:TetR/AcrR family transcriptional regulator [Sinorhizobium meliloti]RVH01731.1 TetR/AcrR family transcriptional regulator [Sinorhizobium meliloti]RVM12496.1 TetR/AcrR family transcriptional regulator [Sinorhizobium meliloti]RVO32639.1 TetR/AcrR family transcriptional regulator [Sinorhizobium meliloti]
MDYPVRPGADSENMRARIQEVAEEHFRRIGHHKTSVADIASELGMSRANVYRFFPSRDAIKESICRRVLNGTAELALTIARRSTPPSEKLEELLTAVHHHNKPKLLHDRQMHDLIVAAMQENRPVIKVHAEQMMTILEAIIREGIETGQFEVEDPAEAARAVKTAFIPSDSRLRVDCGSSAVSADETGMCPKAAIAPNGT